MLRQDDPVLSGRSGARARRGPRSESRVLSDGPVARWRRGSTPGVLGFPAGEKASIQGPTGHFEGQIGEVFPQLFFVIPRRLARPLRECIAPLGSADEHDENQQKYDDDESCPYPVKHLRRPLVDTSQQLVRVARLRARQFRGHWPLTEHGTREAPRVFSFPDAVPIQVQALAESRRFSLPRRRNR